MADCILVVGATTQIAQTLLQRLVKDAAIDDQASVVPWTIVNKYYTAEVKFIVRPLSLIQDEPLTPALLFVWNKGHPLRDQIRQLSQRASQHESEVTLAIRLPPSSPSSPADIEDDQDIDAYLSAEGFEFVDVPDIESSSPDRTGIPRIVDALSTIMWPSMVRQTSKGTTTADFIGAVQMSQGFSSDDYHHLVQLIGEKTAGDDGDRMWRELEELERWLDGVTLSSDVDARSEDEGVPWSTVVTPGTLSPSLSGSFENSRPTTPKAGFDDDFTSFVSASPVGISQASSKSSSQPRAPPLSFTNFSSTFNFNSASSDCSTPIFDDHASFDAARLAPGESYKPLGSMSDLGDSDRETVDLDLLSNDSDGGRDMSTRVQIAETSRKIFGFIPLSLSPVQERGYGPFQAEVTLDKGTSQGDTSDGVDIETTHADLERLDLQSMLDRLQGLKEELAGMPDRERREAAARVALSLAYGLGGNPDSEASRELV